MTDLRARRHVASTQLAGRSRELTKGLAGIRATPSLVVIEGEAGVGKSRFIDELAAQVDHTRTRVVVGRCHPFSQRFPFGPIVEALRGITPDAVPRSGLSGVLGAVRPLLPEFASVLPPAPAPTGDEALERHVMFRALLEFVRILGPTVCVLEDMQWSDLASAEFVRYLASEMPTELSLIVSYRPEDLPADTLLKGITGLGGGLVRRIRLRPLHVSEVHQQVTEQVGRDDISLDFAAHVWEQAAGLPFAVHELTRVAQEQLDDSRRPHRPSSPWLPGPLAVPAAVRDAVLDRASRLDDFGRGVVDAAAVAGVPVEEALLAAVAGLEPRLARDAIVQALRGAILFETEAGRYALRHPLAVRAVHESIPRPRRAQLHLRAAHYLERQEVLQIARLVNHFKEAAHAQEWAQYAEVAADQAGSRWEWFRATQFLYDVLAHAEVSRTTRGRLARKLGLAAIRSQSRQPEVAVLLEHITEEGPMETGDRARLRYLLAILLQGHGEASKARVLLSNSARALMRRGLGFAIYGMTELASPWVLEGQAREHLRWSQRALDASEGCDDGATKVAALSTRASLLIHLGDRAAWDAVRKIPKTGRSVDEAVALMLSAVDLAWASLHLGHYRRCHLFLRAAERHMEHLRYVEYRDATEATAATLQWATGLWQDLEVGGLERAQAAADGLYYWLPVRLIAGLLALARGDTRAAEDRLATSLEEVDRAGLVPWRVVASAGLARIALNRGDVGRAGSLTTDALEIVAAKGIWPWVAEVAPVAVAALVEARRGDDALALVKRLNLELAGRDAPLAQAALTLCTAQLHEADGRPDVAVRAALTALRAYERLPRPLEAGRVAGKAAQLLLRTGDEGRAVPLATRALDAFAALHATGEARELRDVLRRHGLPSPKPAPRGRRPYGDALSPREHDVARLAVEGKTNPEIARALFLSTWTVKEHLSAAMRKLGVRSRTMLADRWPRG